MSAGIAVRKPASKTRQPNPLPAGLAGVHRPLLVCGILSSLLYVAMLIVVPMQWPGYSSGSQTVSELSAIDAPTRSLWVTLGTVYTLLFVAFGWGVLLSADRAKALRIAGSLMIVQGLMGLLWPPMHARGTEFTLTDVLHIGWTMMTLLLMLLAIGFGAAAMGKRFRLYSIVTVATFVLFGTFTGIAAPRVAADLPTPWLGVWERINVGAFLLWVVVLAAALLRHRETPPEA
jgi:hypothetical protein